MKKHTIILLSSYILTSFATLVSAELPSWTKEVKSHSPHTLEFAYAETGITLPSARESGAVGTALVVTPEFLANADIIRIGISEEARGFLNLRDSKTIFYAITPSEAGLTAEIYFAHSIEGRTARVSNTRVGLAPSQWIVISSLQEASLSTGASEEVEASTRNFYLAVRYISE